MGNLTELPHPQFSRPRCPPCERRKKPVVRRSEPVAVAMSAFVSNRARHVRSRRKLTLHPWRILLASQPRLV
jgi:hypothetical protein